MEDVRRDYREVVFQEPSQNDKRLPGSKFPRRWKVESGGTTVYEGDDPVYAFDLAEMLREEEPRGIGIKVVCILVKEVS